MTGMRKWAYVAMLGIAWSAFPVIPNGQANDLRGESLTAAVPPAGQDDIEGKFESLSAGNRKIALALFDAQGDSIGGDVALTLDEIAAAKHSGAAWSDLFRQMRAEGLIDQPNLGEVISGAVRKWNTPAPGYAGKSHAPHPRRGAYKSLSAKDREIAGVLFDNQSIGPKGRHAWTLDQIATARQNGVRWSRVLKLMRDDGLIRARSLGDIVRNNALHVERANPNRGVVVTNGHGDHVVVTTRSPGRAN